jgi:periplasmic protein TonB
MTSLPVLQQRDDHRLWLACGAAAGLHLLLLFGISFSPQSTAIQSLEVTLLAMASREAPLTARVLAPVTQAGGGKHREVRAQQAASNGVMPLPGLHQATDLATRAAQSPKGTVMAVTTHATADHFIHSSREQTPTGTDQAAQLQRREQAGDVPANPGRDASTRLASDNSQRMAMGLGTLASRQAAYRDTWRRYVERAGAANFPWSALTMGQPKSLTLHVVMRADGSVARTQILRSSGLPMLDKAALDILRIAGPFPPFPEGLRQASPELAFSYMWEFLPGEQAALRIGGP